MSWGPATKNRVILLLDLDCFYAQCECIRLGYDASTTALALLQWNSVLAVTYPARTQFGVTRGDSWQGIKEKVIKAKQQERMGPTPKPDSNTCDTCHAVHVPLLTTDRIISTTPHGGKGNPLSPERPRPGKKTSPSPLKSPSDPHTASQASKAIPSLEEEYNSIFRLSKEQQEACRSNELGVRRLSHEGKASIERYRIASARIFQVVHDLIIPHKIQLEKASIDEFFLDVTEAVQQDNKDDSDSESLWTEALIQSARRETKQTMEDDHPEFPHSKENKAFDILDGDSDSDCGNRNGHDDDSLFFWRGAAIALVIRRHVFEALGFTLTAGVGNNKTVAKLTASYGKPNGQALTLPSQVQGMFARTPIGKCRNLGGKLGSQIQQLLQQTLSSTLGDSNDSKSLTVAMIARHLCLPTLRQALGAETAEWAFNLSAYGIDKEPVVPKQDPNSAGAASKSKSLTAVKSLPNSRSGAGHTVDQAAPWIHLLATDLVTRVQRDASRNGRFPRTCTMHYTRPLQDKSNGNHSTSTTTTVTKSVRVQFPSSFQHQEVPAIVETFCRLAAETLIQKEGATLQLTRVGFSVTDFVHQQSSKHSIDRFFSVMNAKATENTTNGSALTAETQQKGTSATAKPAAKSTLVNFCENNDDADLALAKKLQAQYDEMSASSTTDKQFNHGEVSPTVRPSDDVQSVVLAEKEGPSDQPIQMNRDPGLQIHCGDGSSKPVVNDDEDFALARKLQAQYDREDRAWQRLGRLNSSSKRRKTIDSFFSKTK